MNSSMIISEKYLHLLLNNEVIAGSQHKRAIVLGIGITGGASAGTFEFLLGYLENEKGEDVIKDFDTMRVSNCKLVKPLVLKE